MYKVFEHSQIFIVCLVNKKRIVTIHIVSYLIAKSLLGRIIHYKMN